MKHAHLGLLGVLACGATRTVPIEAPEPTFGATASFALEKSALRAAGATDAVLEKLDKSAYHYFRMLGPQFSGRTCHAMRDLRWRLPLVAVHGDAHVTQYVVTSASAGLEDFDQSGFGPAVIDQVRYAASLHLLCREVGWPCDEDAAVAAFFEAYRGALDRQPQEAVEPTIARRLRSGASPSTETWLAWAESLMGPIPDQPHLERAWAGFADLQREMRSDQPPDLYRPVRVGSLQIGIGSCLERKVLWRVRGLSDAPQDDLVLEARAVLPPTSIACAWRPPHAGAMQALMFMSLLGRRMPEVFGFVALDDDPTAPEYWVQSWEPGYRELDLGDIASQSELEELATDAAQQLAGHFWQKFPPDLRAHQRRAQLAAFDLTEARARALARALSAEVTEAWQRFVTEP